MTFLLYSFLLFVESIKDGATQQILLTSLKAASTRFLLLSLLLLNKAYLGELA